MGIKSESNVGCFNLIVAQKDIIGRQGVNRMVAKEEEKTSIRIFCIF